MDDFGIKYLTRVDMPLNKETKPTKLIYVKNYSNLIELCANNKKNKDK